MSQKITSKNLSYNSSLPPFLAALHAQAGGSGEPAPGAQRRAAKKRSGSEEAEDAPLVVDDDGNVVNVEVDKEGVVRNGEAEDKDNNSPDEKTDKKTAESSKAAIGGRKRKVGKVIGGEGDQEPDGDKGSSQSAKGDKNKDKDGPKEKKPKKKAKKIKLSFDEEDG